VHFRLDAAPVETDDVAELAAAAGAPPPVAVVAAAPGVECVARVSPRSRVAEGQTIRFIVDMSRAHFFDPETGLAIAPPTDSPDEAAPAAPADLPSTVPDPGAVTQGGANP
jgi:multiple sugar transport system ATP-binding protein